ncbi:MAG: hypothetical protein PHS98_02320 [Bacilli bacterium]|nr:hypothetical protein [Bacilli bacterium]
MDIELERALNKNKLNKKDLLQLVERIFTAKKQELGLTNTRLSFGKGPSRPYGSIVFRGNLNDVGLRINLNRFLSTNEAPVKILFNLYNTLIHELEHAKVFEKTREEEYYDYEHLMSLLEYINYAKKYNIDPCNPNINIIKKIFIKRIIDINYSFSTTEIKSQLTAYVETLNIFAPYLSKEDIKKYKRIIEALQLLNDSMEIVYNENKRPINKFLMSIINAQSMLKAKNELIQKFGILKNLFHENGNIKSVYELYKGISEANKEMYDKLIMNLLLSLRVDFTQYFADEEFKTYIGGLADKYNDMAINYFKNMDLVKIIITDEKVLKYNLVILKSKVQILNELTNLYGLSKNSGTLYSYAPGKVLS